MHKRTLAYLHCHIIRVCECAAIELIDWPLRSFSKSKYIRIVSYMLHKFTFSSFILNFMTKCTRCVMTWSQIEKNSARSRVKRCIRQNALIRRRDILVILVVVINLREKNLCTRWFDYLVGWSKNWIKSNISTILYLW